LLSEFPGISRRIGGDTFDYCELVRQRGRAGAESDPETKSMYPSGFLNGLPVVDPDGPAMRRVIRENKAKNTKIQNQKWDEEYTSRQSKAISRFMNAFIGSVGKARWRDDQLQYQSSLLIPRGQDYYRVTSYAVKMRLLGHSDGRILLTKAGLELAGAGSFFLDDPVPLGGKLDGRELNVLLEQIKRNVPEEVDQFRALLSSIKVHQDEYGQGVNPAQIKRGLLNQFLRDCGLPDLGLLPPGESTTVEDLKADGPLLQEKFAAPEPIMGHRNAEAFVAARDKRTGALTRMVDFELIDRDITYPGTGTGMVSVIEITDAGEEFLQDVRR